MYPNLTKPMLIIQDKLVNDDVLQSYFACDLNACKGACCWEGDYGAPIENDEIDQIDSNLTSIRQYLDKESNSIIDTEGYSTYYKDINTLGTSLKAKGDCVFLKRENGVAYCAIEKAYYDGKSDFLKPVSCHLYPVRIDHDPHTGFEILSYHRWHICNAACAKGKKEQIPLHKFIKQGIIRKYGEEFYNELEAFAAYIKK